VTWFRIDDSFGTHPKVLSIPRKDRPTAVGLWTLAGVYAANHLTDGHIAPHMIEELGVPKRFATILVTARLWHVPGDECASCEQQGTLPFTEGFQFHDWLASQPSRAKVHQNRKEDAERKAAARAARASKRPPEPPADEDDEPGDSGTPTRPRPSGPTPGGIPYDVRAVPA
jgi:hypothetical protein